MMKKLSILAFVIISALMSTAFAAFPDVSSFHPHKDAINYVQEKGIVSGYDDGTYRPDQLMTRAEFAKMFAVSRYKNDIDACNTDIYTFPDVPKTEWYAKYVCTLMQKGLIKGYDDGTFLPSQTINFSEAAKIITKHELPQAQQIEGNPWYKHYVTYLEQFKAIPLEVKTLEQPLTRGLFAEILYRLALPVDKAKASNTYDKLTGGVVKAPTDTPAITDIIIGGEPYKPYNKDTFEAAKTSNKPFAIFLTAAWCPDCVLLDEEIVNKMSTLPTGTTILYANFDAEEALKETYKISNQNTILFFDKDGDYSTMLTNADFSSIKRTLEGLL